MELAFFINVVKENTHSKIVTLNVPIVAKQLPMNTIDISIGQMKAHEVAEVIDWTPVINNALELSHYHFNLLNQ